MRARVDCHQRAICQWDPVDAFVEEHDAGCFGFFGVKQSSRLSEVAICALERRPVDSAADLSSGV